MQAATGKMRYLLCLLLACSHAPARTTIPTSTEPCEVLRLRPPPKLAARTCGEEVCLPAVNAVELAKWIADVEETRVGLEGCPMVRPVDE